MRTTTALAVAGAAFLLAMIPAAASAGGGYAEDRAQIQDLMARYLFAMDWRDADAYAATFTEDGVLEYAGGVERGREQIRSMIHSLRERESKEAKPGQRPARERHSITNMVVRIDGDRATARAYWTAFTNDNDERRAALRSYGHYEDELVKRGGEWLFAKRVIYNEQRADRAAPAESPVR